MLESMDEDFCLVQPRGIGGGVARFPPRFAAGEIVPGFCTAMARTSVLNQIDALPTSMLLAESFQFGDVVGLIVGRQKGQFHVARLHDQEKQHVERPMPDVVIFLLFDRSRDGSTKGPPLDDLESRHLIHAQDPDTPLRQACRIPIAPKHLLRPLLEAGIETGRLPVTGAMWLQIDIVQETFSEIPNAEQSQWRSR